MNEHLSFDMNKADAAQIAAHLHACDGAFVPPLSDRVDIGNYASKIAGNAVCFGASVGGKLVGLVAAYCNLCEKHSAFVTDVSVLPAWQGKGIASHLMKWLIHHLRGLGIKRIELEIDSRNSAASALYRKHGFATCCTNGRSTIMYLDMETQMNEQRDYNAEIRDTADHQYSYRFDFDVMHAYMMRSFEPFFRKGSLLELGSFKGDFTRRLIEYFDDITCVEASAVAIDEAKCKLGDKAQFVHSPFETADLPKHYNNIVMTHVLEHLDDPVSVLKRVNNEWLADDGHFFLVCPNANAASRQIAVKMGLITHNAAVTPAEAAHGHRRTYSLDTLERDAVAAGLRVIHRSGIFFKALANFQWDLILKSEIVSQEYLDGCYMLGQHHPSLCSSIFLLCEKGTFR